MKLLCFTKNLEKKRNLDCSIILALINSILIHEIVVKKPMIKIYFCLQKKESTIGN